MDGNAFPLRLSIFLSGIIRCRSLCLLPGGCEVGVGALRYCRSIHLLDDRRGGAITVGFRPEQPLCVVKAIEAYREQNNWLGHFPTDCCESGEGLANKSGELNHAYYRVYPPTRWIARIQL